MLPLKAVLGNRDFRNLWLGQIISQIAVNMMGFVLVLRIYEETSSNTAVSLLILMIGLPAVFFGILAGTLVDAWDKRNVLIITNLIRMVLVLGFFITSETLFWVYALVLAVSIVTQFFIPAEAPTIPRVVPKEFLLTANSLFTFTYYTSVITGFMLSGPALRFFGPHNVFLFLAALLAIAGFFVSQITAEGKQPVAKVGKSEILQIWKDVISGLKVLKHNRNVFEPIILLTASQTLISALVSLAPGFAKEVLKVEVKDASFLIMGPAAIGMVLGSLMVGQFGRHVNPKTLINLGITLAGIFLLFLSLDARFSSVFFTSLILLLLGGANALIDVPSNTTLQTYAPEEVRGRIYGILTSLVGGIGILPVAVTGVAADIFGVGRVIFTLSVLILGAAIYRSLGAKV